MLGRLRHTSGLFGIAASSIACMPMIHRHGAQEMGVNTTVTGESNGAIASRFVSLSDSLEWEAAKTRADRAKGYRIIVNLMDRQLAVVDGADTLLSAPVAIGSGRTVEWAGKSWTFRTPRGARTVVSKKENPVWTPPEWHYVELAKAHNFDLRYLRVGKSVTLKDGSTLTVKNKRVGLIPAGSTEFQPLPADEEIVFDSTLFVPPIGTENRSIPNELGDYALAIGDGFMMHGTPHLDSIGQAASHGCIRMRDEDIEWLYEHVPVGTKVYIY